MVAIAHWGEHCNGGAERVAWELQRTFPDSPLYVGHRDEGIEPDDVEDIHGLFDDKASNWAIARGGFPRAAAYFYKWALSRDAIAELRDYDTLITSGNETMFYCGPDTQVRIHYAHHTSRRHTDLLHAWDNSLKGRIGRGYAFAIRQLISNTASRPDLYVTNSEPVKRRVHKYWGVPKEDIRVVYPPVPTGTFDPACCDTGDYYVSLGRLDNWHKHLDDVIEAFNGTERRLVIAGTGPDEEMLREMAADNIEFVGYVDEERKRELLAGARAMVFAGEEEDFGISTAEALAAGTPLIAPREGFSQFQAQDGRSGVTFTRGRLAEAVDRFERDGVAWSESEIAAFADVNFSREAFARRMRSVVQEAHERAGYEVRLAAPTEEDTLTRAVETRAPERRTVRADGGSDEH